MIETKSMITRGEVPWEPPPARSLRARAALLTQEGVAGSLPRVRFSSCSHPACCCFLRCCPKGKASLVVLRDLERVIAHLPPGKVLQPVITEPHSSTFDGRYSLLHAAAWYSFYKGGVSPYLIEAWAEHFPVHTREQDSRREDSCGLEGTCSGSGLGGILGCLRSESLEATPAPQGVRRAPSPRQ